MFTHHKAYLCTNTFHITNKIHNGFGHDNYVSNLTWPLSHPMVRSDRWYLKQTALWRHFWSWGDFDLNLHWQRRCIGDYAFFLSGIKGDKLDSSSAKTLDSTQTKFYPQKLWCETTRGTKLFTVHPFMQQAVNLLSFISLQWFQMLFNHYVFKCSIFTGCFFNEWGEAV